MTSYTKTLEFLVVYGLYIYIYIYIYLHIHTHTYKFMQDLYHQQQCLLLGLKYRDMPYSGLVGGSGGGLNLRVYGTSMLRSIWKTDMGI